MTTETTETTQTTTQTSSDTPAKTPADPQSADNTSATANTTTQSDKRQGVLEKVAKSNFIQEFKEFINRGSVVDLAVGVAVGGAFTAIVNSLVNDIIMPITSLLAGGLDFSKLSLDIPNIFGADSTAHIAYGNFLQNVINFLIIAFAIFIIVRTMNKLNRAKDAELAKIAEAKAKTDAKAEAKHIVETAKAQAKANVEAEADYRAKHKN